MPKGDELVKKGRPYKVNILGIINYLGQHGDRIMTAYTNRISTDPNYQKPVQAHDALGEVDAIVDVVGGLARRHNLPFPRALKSAIEQYSVKDSSFLPTFVKEAPRQLGLNM